MNNTLLHYIIKFNKRNTEDMKQIKNYTNNIMHKYHVNEIFF